jgi:hypothetical protein
MQDAYPLVLAKHLLSVKSCTHKSTSRAAFECEARSVESCENLLHSAAKNSSLIAVKAGVQEVFGNEA